MRFINPVSGTQMKRLTRCLWKDILSRWQDADLTRITLKDRENVQKMLMYSSHSHLKNLY